MSTETVDVLADLRGLEDEQRRAVLAYLAGIDPDLVARAIAEVTR